MTTPLADAIKNAGVRKHRELEQRLSMNRTMVDGLGHREEGGRHLSHWVLVTSSDVLGVPLDELTPWLALRDSRRAA